MWPAQHRCCVLLCISTAVVYAPQVCITLFFARTSNYVKSWRSMMGIYNIWYLFCFESCLLETFVRWILKILSVSAVEWHRGCEVYPLQALGDMVKSSCYTGVLNSLQALGEGSTWYVVLEPGYLDLFLGSVLLPAVWCWVELPDLSVP